MVTDPRHLLLLGTPQVHPMEPGKTLMNSFMFNVALVLLCVLVSPATAHRPPIHLHLCVLVFSTAGDGVPDGGVFIIRAAV